MKKTILEFQAVQKSFETGESVVPVLLNFDLQLKENETVALVGPSGSGKSTILALAAGLEVASGGKIKFLENELTELDEEERTSLRRKYTGFVFQTFELILSLNALENVMVPAELLGNRHAEEDAKKLLKQVGLSHRLHHLPSQLSGGERQRIAIARAFINLPKLLFADEPTGNLDKKNSDQIVDLLFQLNREHGTALLVATHDLSLAARCERQIAL